MCKSGLRAALPAWQSIRPLASSPSARGLQLALLKKHVLVDYNHMLSAEGVHLVSAGGCLEEGSIISNEKKTKETEDTDSASCWDATHPTTSVCLPGTKEGFLSLFLLLLHTNQCHTGIQTGQVFGPAIPPTVLKVQEDKAGPPQGGCNPKSHKEMT